MPPKYIVYNFNLLNIINAPFDQSFYIYRHMGQPERSGRPADGEDIELAPLPTFVLYEGDSVDEGFVISKNYEGTAVIADDYTATKAMVEQAILDIATRAEEMITYLQEQILPQFTAPEE